MPLLNLTRAEYDATDAINWSTLNPYGRSPAHGLHASRFDPDKAPWRRGRASSMALFEPARFASEVVVFDGRRDPRSKEWQAFQAEHAGKEILKPDEHAEVIAIAHAVRTHKDAGPMLTNGRGEVTVLWDCEGHKAKSMLDWLQNDGGWLVDVKTTRNASPESFGWSVKDFGYLGQAAFYVDAAFQVTGVRRRFAFIAVESTPPHVCQVYRVAEDQLDKGRELYRRLLATWAKCRAEGNYPGYADGPLDLVLPDRMVGHSEEA